MFLHKKKHNIMYCYTARYTCVDILYRTHLIVPEMRMCLDSYLIGG